MFTDFDPASGVLYARKVADLRDSAPVTIFGDIRRSYSEYINQYVYEDITYLEDLLHEKVQGLERVHLRPRILPVHEHTEYTDGQVLTVRYLPVVCEVVDTSTNSVINNFEVLRIPTMTDYGKFNVKGKHKAIVQQLRSSYNISYSIADNTLNIAMPKANIRLIWSKKNIQVPVGKTKQDLKYILYIMMYEAGETRPLTDYITNSEILSRLNVSSSDRIEAIALAMKDKFPIVERYKSEQYKLGLARTSMNKYLGLDRGKGYYLSQDVAGYPAGTLVDDEVVATLLYNRINTYNVAIREYPNGYIYAGDNVIISTIPKGTKNGTKLRTLLPQFRDKAVIPEDVNLENIAPPFGTQEYLNSDGASSIVMYLPGMKMQNEDYEFLYSVGIKAVFLATGRNKLDKPIRFSMEREITGNYTAKLKYLIDGPAPAGRNAEEWVYYYNNPNLEPCNPDHLTCHDFIAMLSLLGEVIDTGKCSLLDRDNAFLKKVMLVGDLFSESLRKSMNTFVENNKRNLSAKVLSSKEDMNPFAGLSNSWYSQMNADKITATTDTVNLLAEISQSSHVTTSVMSSNSVKDEQRHLATPFYGRICPYETPAGGKLGLVNTRALGSRTRDGLLYTPYCKILKSGNGITISNKVVYLSVEDELGQKFTDRMQLKTDANGNYINCKVLAKIPNPATSDEPFIFKNIDAFDMVGGYVEAYPEQFLSPTVAMMPFACCDNPARISFGASQIRQAVNLIDSELDIVTTPMYKDVFELISTIRYASPYTGTIISTNNNSCTIQTKEGNKVVMYDDNLTSTKYQLYIEPAAAVGSKIKQGDTIALGTMYPLDFVVKAPYDGYIVNINHKHIIMSRTKPEVGKVDLEKSDVMTIPLQNKRYFGINATFMNLHISTGDYVTKGTILADTFTSRDGNYTPSRCPLVAFMPNGYNYEDGVTATESAAVEYTSIYNTNITHTESLRRYSSQVPDVLKGFKYNRPGQPILYVNKYLNVGDNMPAAKSPVYATSKAKGICYNVHASMSKDKNRRTYVLDMVSFDKLRAGDKMSGRHGNKGVVSKVLKDSEAPQLMNGLTVRFILGPCGVPSRMNMGQMLELHASLACKVLSIRMESPAFNGASLDDIKVLMKFAWTVANDTRLHSSVDEGTFNSVVSGFSFPAAMKHWVYMHLDAALDWRGVFDEEGCAQLYDPQTGTYFEGKVPIGFPSFNKLMQMADEKSNSRSGPIEEGYSRTTSQPQNNETSAKGQRAGEMELMSLAAYGAAGFIKETLNEKSDNIGARSNLFLDMVGGPNDLKIPSDECSPRSVDNLLYLLEACGVKLEVDSEITKTDTYNARSRTSIDTSSYLREYFGHGSTVKPRQTIDLSIAED